ncbi:MAG: hypothetical protein M3Q81_00615 [bacterium]|nr:hypothetical protein [bacterium]
MKKNETLQLPRHVTKGKVVEDYVKARYDKRRQPDTEYWGELPPSAVFVASASTRKILNAHLQLSGRFPQESEQPLGHQRFLQEKVPNGDGSFEGRIFLGHKKGVPIYGQSTAGETKDNDPLVEADNKANWFKANWEAEHPGQDNVMFVSLDTVNGPTRPDGSMVELGKTMKEPDFPLEAFTAWKQDQVQLAEDEVTEWLARYIEAVYGSSDSILHTTGITVIDMLTDEKHQACLKLEVPIDHEQLSKIKGDAEASGAGVIQYIIDYSPQGLLKLLAEQRTNGEYYQRLQSSVARALEKPRKPEQSSQRSKNAHVGLWLITQIQGMPFIYLEDVLKDAARKRQLEPVF